MLQFPAGETHASLFRQTDERLETRLRRIDLTGTPTRPYLVMKVKHQVRKKQQMEKKMNMKKKKKIKKYTAQGQVHIAMHSQTCAVDIDKLHVEEGDDAAAAEIAWRIDMLELF